MLTFIIKLKKLLDLIIFKIKYNNINKIYNSSCTDDNIYPNFCLKAVNSDNIFKNFRRNKDLIRMQGNLLKDKGEEFLKIIINEYRDLFHFIDYFKENDCVGNPKTFAYPIIGKISPVTLRQIKILGNLLSLFKDLSDFTICEIGIGFGGQYKIIDKMCRIRDYTLVDILPALKLTDKYLKKSIYKIRSSYSLITPDKVSSKLNFDLVISNYAFSELKREFQQLYINNIILKSKRGYMIMNQVAPKEFDSFTKNELLKIIPNSHIINENPITHPLNYVLIWGD